jgi:hypothetical protein
MGAILVIGICGFAWLKGDEPERLVAGTYVLGWLASLLAQGSVGIYVFGWILGLIDVVMLIVLGAISWKSKRTWPVWGCACQLLIVMSHVLMFVDRRPGSQDFIFIINLAGYGVLLSLAIGTFWAWQDRRAANFT